MRHRPCVVLDSRAMSLAAMFAASLLVAHEAVADPPLRVRADNGDTWEALVTRLQNDVRSEGQTFHLFVLEPSGGLVPCERYRLEPSIVARESFEFGTCNESSRATMVTLSRRTTLFGHNGVVPEPRAVPLVAVYIAPPLRVCAADVRPTIADLEHGTRVPVTPDHFSLTSESGVVVSMNGDHWTLRREAPESASARYAVVDRENGRVLANESVTLACGAPVAARPAPEPLSLERPTSTASPMPDFFSRAQSDQAAQHSGEAVSHPTRGAAGRSLAEIGGIVALMSFTIGGAVLYAIVDSRHTVTTDDVIWDTVFCGSGVVSGGIMALVGLSMSDSTVASSTRPHHRAPHARVLAAGAMPASGGIVASVRIEF